MPYQRRWKWVQSLTGKETLRAAAGDVGVYHSTLSRWMKSGIPIGTLSDLIVRFECDPIEALVVWGYLDEEDIPKLNYSELVRYVPIDVLAKEMSRRATEYSKTREDTERRTSVGMLKRA